MLAAQRTSACGHIVSVKHQKQQQKRYRIDINFHIFSVFAAVCFSAQSPQPVLMNLFFFFSSSPSSSSFVSFSALTGDYTESEKSPIKNV